MAATPSELDVLCDTIALIYHESRNVRHLCKRLRGGKGSHEIWQAPNGNRFPIPRHPGDLRKGTLAQIIRDAGWKSHISEFLRERV